MPRLILATLALGLPLALAACETPPATASGDTAASASVTATASADPAAASEGTVTPMPGGLSSEERFLWSTMTPAAQAQAATYIANGGTLTQFMAL